MIVRQVQATEAKTRFAEFVRMVEGGESIVITRHGRPVAHLAPAQDEDRTHRREAMNRFMQARSRWEPSGRSSDEILVARSSTLGAFALDASVVASWLLDD